MNRVEIVYSIKELLKEHGDDSLISSRHILFLFNNSRAKYLRQLYSNRAKEFDSSSTQSFMVDMETVSKGAYGVEVPCNIRRSTIKIPSLLGIRGRSALISVGPAIVGSPNFEIINNSNVSSCLADKYSTTLVFIEDSYLYVVGKSPAVNMVSKLKVTGIFDNPDSLVTFKDAAGLPVVSDSTEYPIPGHLTSLVSSEVVKEYMIAKGLEQVRDIENDSVPSNTKVAPSRTRVGK